LYSPAVVIGPVFSPDAFAVGWLPDHPSEPLPPLAVHAVAFVVDQVMTTELPGVTLAGETIS